MTKEQQPYGDPTTYPFWEAAKEHKLLVQRCDDCEHHQFYPRPFCLACESTNLSWVESKGDGTIYSQTTVHIQVEPHMDPPYTVGLVELDEGIRFLGNIKSDETNIGDAVELEWEEREEMPPLPVFRKVSE